MAYSTESESKGIIAALKGAKQKKRDAIGMLAFDIWVVKGGKENEKS